jgi:hypothetical protein
MADWLKLLIRSNPNKKLPQQQKLFELLITCSSMLFSLVPCPHFREDQVIPFCKVFLDAPVKELINRDPKKGQYAKEQFKFRFQFLLKLTFVTVPQFRFTIRLVLIASEQSNLTSIAQAIRSTSQINKTRLGR